MTVQIPPLFDEQILFRGRPGTILNSLWQRTVPSVPALARILVQKPGCNRIPVRGPEFFDNSSQQIALGRAELHFRMRSVGDDVEKGRAWTAIEPRFPLALFEWLTWAYVAVRSDHRRRGIPWNWLRDPVPNVDLGLNLRGQNSSLHKGWFDCCFSIVIQRKGTSDLSGALGKTGRCVMLSS
jgi:hypothetical protein